MNLDDITRKCYILALFIRDDGERFLLGDGAYDFKEDQMHFIGNIFNNDVVEVQGNDGLLLAGQVRRPSSQSFDGYIGDATVAKSDIESYRRDFFAFFRKNYYYTVVYIFQDGTAIQRKRGFIVDAPEVKELFQLFPEYHIALNFEDTNYYDYQENSEGEEIYSKTVNVYPATGPTRGGLIWDSIGVVWDNIGATWEEGGGGTSTVLVESIDNVYPIWEINGPAVNPEIENVETGVIFKYTGSINASQTLTVDTLAKTASLNGVNVLNNLSGSWLYLEPGNNRIVYTTDNVGALPCTLKWQEVVG